MSAIRTIHANIHKMFVKTKRQWVSHYTIKTLHTATDVSYTYDKHDTKILAKDNYLTKHVLALKKALRAKTHLFKWILYVQPIFWTNGCCCIQCLNGCSVIPTLFFYQHSTNVVFNLPLLCHFAMNSILFSVLAAPSSWSLT